MVQICGECGIMDRPFFFHRTVHLSNTDRINANKMQLFYVLYLVLEAVHVSDALCVHHQEHYKL